MTQSAQNPVISVKDVRRSFRSAVKQEGWKGTFGLLLKPEVRTFEAVKGVSFDIQAGAFIGLIGANGAGKTTLLKILSGLIPPTSGEARVLGFEPFQRKQEFRKQIALVMGQKAQLWWDLPAIDAFDLLRAIYQIPNDEYRKRLKLLSELLEVDKHLKTQIRRLSLGERMKMELIGALIHWPRVIFLDEPTIGLDVLAAHNLREFLKEFNRREKATIILTSHNMEDIERLCERVLIIRTGEKIYDGPPGELTREGERRVRMRLLEEPTAEELAILTGLPPEAVEVARPEEDLEEAEEGDGSPEKRAVYFSLKQDQIGTVLQKVTSRFHVVDMGIEEQSLQRVIHRLYEGKS